MRSFLLCFLLTTVIGCALLEREIRRIEHPDGRVEIVEGASPLEEAALAAAEEAARHIPSALDAGKEGLETDDYGRLKAVGFAAGGSAATVFLGALLAGYLRRRKKGSDSGRGA